MYDSIFDSISFLQAAPVSDVTELVYDPGQERQKGLHPNSD